MEPPKPANTNDLKPTSKIDSFKIFNKEEKDQYYLVEFFIEKDILIIHLKSFESKIKLIYENSFTLLDLIKINKYFKMFDSLGEVINNIKDLQEINLISINKNNNDNFDLF